MMEVKKEIKGFAWGTMVGGVVGAVTALLLAPKSGRELRADISGQCQKANSVASEWIGKAKETAEKIGDEVKNRIPFRNGETVQIQDVEDTAPEEAKVQ